MKELKLTILGEPTSKQSVRQGKTKSGATIFFQPEKQAIAAAKIRVQILRQLPKGFVKFSGPLRLESIKYIHAPTKAQLDSKKIGDFLRNGGLLWKATRPDMMDNLNKLLFDVMTGLVYTDDSIICDVGGMSKFYGVNPRVELHFAELEKQII